VNTEDVQLVTDDGQDLCSSVEIEEYGIVKCTTNQITIGSGNVLDVAVGDTLYNCMSVSTDCEFATSSSMPSVSGITPSGDYSTLTFTGTNFLDSGYTATAYYAGVASSSVVLTSTSAVATFSHGIPLSDDALLPDLLFISDSTSEGHYAQNVHTLTNAISVSGGTSATISCSYAGGCELSLAVNGLAGSIIDDQASVTVCGETCTIDESSSNHQTTYCKVPSLSTSYSISNY